MEGKIRIQSCKDGKRKKKKKKENSNNIRHMNLELRSKIGYASLYITFSKRENDHG